MKHTLEPRQTAHLNYCLARHDQTRRHIPPPSYIKSSIGDSISVTSMPYNTRQHCFMPKRRTSNQNGQAMQTTNIMIVDDHPLVRSGFRQLIESENGLNVCCEAATMNEALQLIKHCFPDLAIIDLSLPDGSGLELIKRLHALQPGILILVSSMHDEDLFAERVLRAGAKGYINKQEAGEQVIVALRQVLDGEIYLSSHMKERQLLEQDGNPRTPLLSPAEHLSNRELEVFELIGHGMATGEIAVKLHLSVKTIETHRANIKTKLGLCTAGELTRSAVQWTLDTY
jgi:DNA-binding NarL/FixJ family response regulator